MVADGKDPGPTRHRRGGRRALDAGWTVAVAVDLRRGVGQGGPRPRRRGVDRPAHPGLRRRRRPGQEADPAIYELAVRTLDLDRQDTLVVEDSRNGLLAAPAPAWRAWSP
jgi:hypothetical protein